MIPLAELMLKKPAAEPYEELEEIGRGGMGVVFRARQKSLERVVAVKRVLAEGLSSLEEYCAAGQDFLAEAFVSGRLEHPNIPPIYDLLSTPRGEPYMSMKLIEGQPWSVVLEGERAGDLSFHLDTLIQVCNAVAYAHSRGVVHCDLKPENIMIGAYGEVLVMDWGLAVCFEDGVDDPHLRHRSAITGFCGTPSYMAPELAHGDGENVGPWTDVYLLGGILYTILSGAPPHDGATFVEVLEQAGAGRVPEMDPGWPAELRRICQQALSPDWEERQADVSVVLAALRAYLQHRESLQIARAAEDLMIDCRDALAGQRASTAVPRSARADLYECFAEAVAGFVHARRLWEENSAAIRGERAARTAYAQAALYHGDLGLAEAQVSRLGRHAEELPAQISNARTRRRRQAAASRRLRRGLGAAVALLFLALAGGLYFVNQMRMAVALEKQTVESQNGSINAALRSLLRQNQEIRAQSEALARAKLRAEQRGAIGQETLDRLSREVSAQLLERLGDRRSQQAASRILDVAMAGWRDLRELDLAGGDVTLVSALTRFRYGQQLWKLSGDDPEARAELEAARGMYAVLATGSDSLLARSQKAMVLSSLAEIADRAGEPEHALELGSASVALLRQLVAGEPAELRDVKRLAGGLQQLGDAHLRRRSLAEAQELYTESVAIQERILAEQSAMGRWMLKLGVVPDLYADPLSIYLNLADPGRSAQRQSLFRALLQLGDIQAELGATKDALQAYRTALRSELQLFAQDSEDAGVWRDLYEVRGRLARLLEEEGEHEERLAMREAQLRLAGQLTDRFKDQPEVRARELQAWLLLGEAAWAAGHPERAREAVETLRAEPVSPPAELLARLRMLESRLQER